MRRLMLTALCVVALWPAAPARAIVPPTDCGTTTVKGKRYTIKADQIRCSSAKRLSRSYLSTGRRPAGYACRTYSRQTKLKFRCARGIKVFFAIKR